MKKFWKILCPVLCLALTVPYLFACGTLVYEDGTLPEGTVGIAYEASVAGAKGGSNIKYEVDYGYLPDGLTLSEDGTISGTPKVTNEADEVITIRASANGREDAIAEFVLVIKAGTFTFSDSTLKDATAGKAYSASVTATGALNTVTYEIKNGSNLPDGLYMNSEGSITGMPLVNVDAHQFTVIASAKGYQSVEATFTITVLGGDINIGDEIRYDESRMVFDLGEKLVGEEITADLTADQIVNKPEENLVTRYLANYSGTAGLPVGLKVEQTGVLTGIPLDSTTGTLTFTVKACVVTINKNEKNTSTPSGFKETENKDYASVAVTVNLRVLDLEVVTNKFEAEWVDLSGKSGAGYSDSASGTGMIQSFSGASGGFSLGFMHAANLFIDFIIHSDKATTATLKLRLASEIGTITFDEDMFKISVNDVEKVSYNAFTIIGVEEHMTVGEWQVITIVSIPLKAGDNTIRFTIADDPRNTYLESTRIGGPEFDYMELSDTDAVLKWRPKVRNTFGKQ